MVITTLPWSAVNNLATTLPPEAVTQKMRWFRNIKRQPFDSGSLSLDYSLQLQDGLEAWCEAESCNSR